MHTQSSTGETCGGVALKWLIAVVALILSEPAFGQDSLRIRYSIDGGISINQHIADFRALPGVPNCCPQFSNGSGTEPFFGIDAAWPIADRFLFSIGLNYVDHSATLQNDQTLPLIVNGSFQNGTDRHSVDATLRSIALQPTVAFNFAGGFFLDAGMRAGYLMTRQYSQDERIVSSAGTFIDSSGNDSHSQIRNQNSGAIPQASFFLAEVVGGIRYELPMNSEHSLFLVPSARYLVALTNVASGILWRPNGLLAGLGITYSPKPEYWNYVYDTVLQRDTISKLVRNLMEDRISLLRTEHKNSTATNSYTVTTTTTVSEHYLRERADPHDVMGTVTAVALEDDSTEHPIATLKIEEFLSMNAHPLLGYVFFSEGDSSIPSRYQVIDRAETSKFDLHSLFSLDALGINHNALNIIAVRLKEHPHAHLTITGCNADAGVESSDTALSASRARAVSRYFQDIWNIPSSRFTVVARNLPEKPSNPRTPLGQEENRRVELTCDDPAVLDVFLANDTTRIPAPPQIRFKMKTASSVGIASWKLEVRQRDNLLYHAEGIGNAPESLDWDITHDYSAIPHYGTPITIALRTTNTKGDDTLYTYDLPTDVLTVQEKRARHSGDVIIDRYNLVLFDFAHSTTLPAHERVLKMVREHLKPSSQILFEGYTDRTGTSAGNKRLATERATSSANALGRSDTQIKGIGDTRLLYPNDTPEGRFLCRTVQITVRTPIQ